jgi:uncharacterized protein YjdB
MERRRRFGSRRLQVPLTAVVLALAGALAAPLPAQAAGSSDSAAATNRPISGRALHHDTSAPLRSIPPKVSKQARHEVPERELPVTVASSPDPVVQSTPGTAAMPSTSKNIEGIGYPGVNCNCFPPDTNGEVGTTQYVQTVNVGLQVWNKSTGTSVYGPVDIATLWSGFGGYCEVGGAGDPVVLFDQLAGRWVVSQFAGTSTLINHECIAVSTTDDATGSYYRYDFLLGGNFYDYPKLSVWPDAYYLTENVFNSTGTAYLGPQPFALDRTAMLQGQSATFVSPGLQSSSLGFMLSADLDGSATPPAGAANPWLSTQSPSAWTVFHFHPDFATPANTTWGAAGSIAPAGYTSLCPFTSSCVPQLGTTARLDGLADRLMYRLAYRLFPDGHEALVGNYTVSASGIAAPRWFELTNVTSGTPAFVQQSTYAPDSTWRWMGSAAMDASGNMALGYSASSAAIYPSIRYAGRLAGDPPNTLPQAEASLIAGTGSQTDTIYNRWGDYSAMTVDPVDDCTFWYTNEYYTTTARVAWHTRIGSFKFPTCSAAPVLSSIAVTPAAPSVPKGTTTQLTATATYSDGSTADVTSSATWSSDNPAVATVSNAAGSQGLVTGVSEGSATVTATVGTRSGTSAVTVTAPALSSIAVTPASTSVVAGSTTQLTATGTYSDGSTADVTESATWSSDTTAVATVSDTAGSKGLVQGVSTGSAQITAAVGTISGSSSVSVTPAQVASVSVTPSSASIRKRATVQLTATATYTDGTTADVTSSVTWTSSRPRIATVSSTGLVTGVRAGTVTITASYGGHTGTSTVTVLGGRPAP